MQTCVYCQAAGKIGTMARSPTGSRVLQTCVKHGTPEQREQVRRELQPSFVELSKSPYAHFLVCKLIDTAPKTAIDGKLVTHLRSVRSKPLDVWRRGLACDDAILRYLPEMPLLWAAQDESQHLLRPCRCPCARHIWQLALWESSCCWDGWVLHNVRFVPFKCACARVHAGILRAFKGQVVRLLRHPSACSVINELHMAANAKQRRELAAEFYSRQATLFQQVVFASDWSWPACCTHRWL